MSLTSIADAVHVRIFYKYTGFTNGDNHKIVKYQVVNILACIMLVITGLWDCFSETKEGVVFKFFMLRKLAVALAVAALSAPLAVSAADVVIDFEGVVADDDGFSGANVTPYTEDGYTLSSDGSEGVYHNDIFGALSGVNTNGTDIFGWCSYCPPYTFTLTGPSPFDLISIDFAGLSTEEGGEDGDGGEEEVLDVLQLLSPIDVTGFFAGGGSIVQTVNPTDIWTTFLFEGFTDLASVTIQAQFGGDIEQGGENFAMDNIVLANDTVVTVPEPSTIALFGLGLGGALFARRRTKVTATA